MKTIFIINPKAGKENKAPELMRAIEAARPQAYSAAAAHQSQPDNAVATYLTQSVGDAEQFVRRILAQQTDNEELHLIACGGDGTLNEVLNGAVGHENVCIGALPIGTGNDFCRNFQPSGDFSSIPAQLNAQPILCDAIRYSGHINGKQQTRYCANMFNIGFDCDVVDLTATIKKTPLISGSLAYMLSVLLLLARKRCTQLEITLDDRKAHSGKLLLTSIANGATCGGGIKSNPTASVQDGLIDINIIRNTSRLNFIRLLPSYTKGTHMQRPGVEKIILSRKCKRITVTPLNGLMRLCADGEITDAGTVEFEIVPNAFRFLVPQK